MSVYRPLFNELSDDAYAIAKGILEEALRAAADNKPAPHYQRSKTSPFVDVVNNSLAAKLCERFGWQQIAMWRDALHRVTCLAVRLGCGHKSEVEISENVLEDMDPGEFLLSLERYGESGRRCYCVQHEAQP